MAVREIRHLIPDLSSPRIAVTVGAIEKDVTFGLLLDLNCSQPWCATYRTLHAAWCSGPCASEPAAIGALRDYVLERDPSDAALLLFDDLHLAMVRGWTDYVALCMRDVRSG